MTPESGSRVVYTVVFRSTADARVVSVHFVSVGTDTDTFVADAVLAVERVRDDVAAQHGEVTWEIPMSTKSERE